LKVLQNFSPDDEWVLEPGDMLYLPPHLAHDGIAEGPCVTCSIGFRAPQVGELTSQFLYHLAEQASAAPGAARHYGDAGQPPTQAPARIPSHLLEEVGAILARVKWSEREVGDFLGRYMSEPKANVFFDPPQKAITERVFFEKAEKRGVELDRKTVLLYDGEPGKLNDGSRKLLMQLADARHLGAQNFVTLTHHSPMTALLCEWYRAGWIRVS
jgi:50S ribosomal protein L16 3-hydroxylase